MIRSFLYNRKNSCKLQNSLGHQGFQDVAGPLHTSDIYITYYILKLVYTVQKLPTNKAQIPVFKYFEITMCLIDFTFSFYIISSNLDKNC